VQSLNSQQSRAQLNPTVTDAIINLFTMARLAALTKKNAKRSNGAEPKSDRPIKYKLPFYPEDEVLRIEDIATLGSNLLSAGTSVRQLVFAPGVNVNEYVTRYHCFAT
jgi:hypothetical protein